MIKEAWGRIQAQEVQPIAHEGDTWLFQVPRSTVGRVIAEFWVKDYAGNIGYRSALLTIEHGTIKCIEWLRTGGIQALPFHRPSIEYIPPIKAIDQMDRPTIIDISTKPYVIPLPHVCPRIRS